MEALILIGFVFILIFFMITMYNFYYYIFNKIRISKYIEKLKKEETEPLFILAAGGPLDVFRILDRVPISNETKDQHLTIYILKHRKLKKRILKYGIIMSFIFILTFILITNQ